MAKIALLILAVVFVVAQALTPNPGQAFNTGSGHRQNHQTNTRNQPPSSPPAVSSSPIAGLASTEETQAHRSEDKQQTVKVTQLPSVDFAHGLFDYFSLGCAVFLAIVGFFGVRYAKRTLADLQIQTKATTVAADAAKAAADAQMTGERAWILVEQIAVSYNTSNNASLSYSITNYGRTPAIIHALERCLDIGDSGTVPPRCEIYSKEDFAVRPYLIPQNDSRKETIYLSDIPGGDFFLLAASRKFFWAYGVVKYSDVFGTRHETRFCYRSDQIPGMSGNVQMRLDGPPEYNEIT